MKSIILGLLASLFFSASFILNRSMELAGGSWIWSASLRYVFMLPFLMVIVVLRNDYKPLLNNMRKNTAKWILWSTIGFGLFYAPLCFSASFGASWLVASTWQITIIAGALLTPLFKTKIIDGDKIKTVRHPLPVRGLLISIIILIGIVLMQLEHMQNVEPIVVVEGVLPVVIASFAYPLGNRKMMELCKNKIGTFERVLGMTIASMPFWILLMSIGVATVGFPTGSQTLQSLIVALSSGLIATVLFFKATDSSKDNMHRLAAVEATQSGEVVFSLLGEIVLLGGLFPSIISLIGMGIVVIGMIIHSIFSK